MTPRLATTDLPTLDADARSPRSAIALIGLPARPWLRDEYAAWQASEAAPPIAVLREPQAEALWAQAPMEAVAARWAAAVLAAEPVQPRSRPLALLGWSVGGLLALETARQLMRAGREVAWIGLVDVSLFGGLRETLTEAPPLSAAERTEREAVLQAALATSALRAQWQALLHGMSAAQRDAVLRQLVQPPTVLLPLDGAGAGSQEHQLWSRLACLRLALSYTPAALPSVRLRRWCSAEAVGGPGGVDEPAPGLLAGLRTEPMPETTHLGVVSSAALWHQVRQALAAVGAEPAAPVARGA